MQHVSNNQNSPLPLGFDQTLCFDLSQDMGLIQVYGPDTLTFLQGLLTCDIYALPESDPVHTPHILGAFCNLKGRIRALFKIFKLSSTRVLLQLPKALIPIILPALKKQALFSKIKLTEVTEQYQQWGVLQKKQQVDEKLQAQEKSHVDEKSQVYENPQVQNIIEERSILILPIQSQITDHLSNITFKAFNDWVLNDIQAGIPEIWAETTEQFLPHYINLPKLGGVSFTKGCYCGQEIIARMEYKAKIKYALKHVVLIEEPKEKITVGAETTWGTIVSIAQNQTHQLEFLAIQTI